MVQKIIINRGSSRFKFSQKALQFLHKNKVNGVVKQGKYNLKYNAVTTELRINPFAIKIVEELGRDASGELALLKVVKIPNNVKWHIAQLGNSEYVREDSREWWE